MKQDLRITKTEIAIEQAFLELIEERGFSNVHIVDIAKRANVNRNTVYLRYGTKEEIISAILKKTYKKQMSSLPISEIIKTKRNRRSIEEILETIFTVLYDEIELYRIVLTDTNLSGYVDNELAEARKSVLMNLEDTTKNRIVVECLVQSVFGVIRNWIIYDTGTIEENINVLARIISSNMKLISLR